MGKVVNLGHGIHLSVSSISEEFGSTRETVAKRLAAAKIKPSGKRGGYPVYRLRDAIAACLVTTADGEIDPDKLKPFERHAYYKAEREKLQLQCERAELLSSLEAEQKFAALFKAIAEFFDTLPDVIERDCGASPMMIAKLEDRLDQLREQLYAQAVEIGDDDAAGTAEARG